MNKNKKINFILPFKPRRPAGGFKVMYEYANRLARIGYDVHLYFPIETPFMNYRLPYICRYILTIIEGFRRDKWFDFDQRITMSYIPSVKDKYIADADIVIATWWATAQEMGKLSKEKGKKINLIQGFENWEGNEDLLFKSYDMKGVTNVVVASYLADIVNQYTTKRSHIIHNAVDSEVFTIKNTIESRNPCSIAMIYSIQEIKGSKYGIEALKLVKEQIPKLEVELFGICPEPENLPEWMKFHRNPSDLADLYNRNSIFITNSFTEGFSLVILEALLSGCAVVCTDIEGHQHYRSKDGDAALFVEAGNSRAMADQIIKLIENNDYRIKLAKQGNTIAKQFDWNNAVRKMDSLIKQLLTEKD